MQTNASAPEPMPKQGGREVVDGSSGGRFWVPGIFDLCAMSRRTA